MPLAKNAWDFKENLTAFTPHQLSWSQKAFSNSSSWSQGFCNIWVWGSPSLYFL